MSTIIQTIEDAGRKALTAIEHAAAWLVGAVATSEASLHTLEAASPLVVEALAVGEAAATSYGVPVTTVQNAGEAVLTAAKALAAGLATAPLPTTATAPNAGPVA